jgi:anti-sigma28 factor (negative regulator of flagellin synthesis)
MRAEGSINGETSFGLYRDNPDRSGDTFEIAVFANVKIVGEFLNFSYEEPLAKVPVGKIVVQGLLVSVDSSQIDLTAIANAAKKVAEIIWEKAVNKTAEGIGDMVEYLGGPKNPLEVEERIKEGNALYQQLLEDRKKLLYPKDIKPFCQQKEYDEIDGKLAEFNLILSQDQDKKKIVDSFMALRNAMVELHSTATKRKTEYLNKQKAKAAEAEEEFAKLKAQDAGIETKVKFGKLGGSYAEAQGPGNILHKKIHEDTDEKRKANATFAHNKGFKHWDNANKTWQKRGAIGTDNVENLKKRIELGNYAIAEYALAKDEWQKGKEIYH